LTCRFSFGKTTCQIEDPRHRKRFFPWKNRADVGSGVDLPPLPLPLDFARGMLTKEGKQHMKTLLLAILILSLAGCATTGSGRFRNLFEEDLAQHRESIKFGNLPEAIAELSMLLEMDPKNAEARFLRAVAYQKLEHYSKAIEDYMQILQYDPNHSRAHYNIGMILAFKTYDKSEALKHFDRFISLNPKDPKTFTVAKTMLALDEPSVKDEPTNLNQIVEDALASQGLIRAEDERDIDKRKNMISDAIRASPQSARLHFAMGKTLEQEGKYEYAVKSYKTALELKPTYGECHYDLGRLLMKKGHKEDAQIHLIKASLFQPNGPNL